MPLDIFRLDWIFIDTIIIILLIFLLLIVKFFKERFRWRTTLSNEALESIIFETKEFSSYSKFFKIKSLSLVRNLTFHNEALSKPIIIIPKIKFNRKLIYILTEGLVSYGYQVVIIDLVIDHGKDIIKFHKNIQNEFETLFSGLLEHLKNKNLIKKLDYFLIYFPKNNSSFTFNFFNPNSKGIILINPFIDYKKIINEQLINYQNKPKFFIIFSKKNKFSKWVEKKSKKDSNITFFDKAKNSFKYYETILFSYIILFIEKSLPQT